MKRSILIVISIVLLISYSACKKNNPAAVQPVPTPTPDVILIDDFNDSDFNSPLSSAFQNVWGVKTDAFEGGGSYVTSGPGFSSRPGGGTCMSVTGVVYAATGYSGYYAYVGLTVSTKPTYSTNLDISGKEAIRFSYRCSIVPPAGDTVKIFALLTPLSGNSMHYEMTFSGGWNTATIPLSAFGNYGTGSTDLNNIVNVLIGVRLYSANYASNAVFDMQLDDVSFVDL